MRNPHVRTDAGACVNAADRVPFRRRMAPEQWRHREDCQSLEPGPDHCVLQSGNRLDIRQILLNPATLRGRQCLYIAQ
ncbi:hypothetical protein GCM10027297_27940 [Parahaliea aestuarii]